MIRPLGFIVFLFASSAFAATSNCQNLEDTHQSEACSQNKNLTKDDLIAKGLRAYHGKDEAKDYHKALKLFLQAAKTGKIQAYELVADMYAKGQGTQQDYKESTAWYRKAADNGRQHAQFALGNFYLTGKGVEIDEQQAFQWFEKAAKGGDKRAYLVLGLMHEKGRGTENNPEQALKWFEKSAKTGNVAAQFYTGEAYTKGKGTTRDANKAVLWLQKAEQNGHAKAADILTIAKKMQSQEAAKAAAISEKEQKTVSKDTVVGTETQTSDKPPAQKASNAAANQKVSQKPDTKPTPKSKQYPRRATVFAPSSNVRITPGRRVICSVDTVKTINIGRSENGWYATDVCGRKGYIHKSQIRILR